MSLHAYGAFYLIALAFKNSASVVCARVPMCFNTYSGILLFPELLLGLNDCSSTAVTSAVFISCSVWFSIISKLSASTLGS